MDFLSDITIDIDSLINICNSDNGMYTGSVPDSYFDLGDAFDPSNIFGY